MGWSDLIALASLAVAAFSIYLGYRERLEKRTADYRQVLYSRQIEVYAEIMAVVGQVFDKLLRLRLEIHSGVELRDRLDSVANEAFIDVAVLVDKAACFVPSDVGYRLVDFWALLQVDWKSLSEETDEENLRLFAARLDNASTDLVLAIREAVGVDPLTAEGLRLFVPASLDRRVQ
jgi:hypothetical protein